MKNILEKHGQVLQELAEALRDTAFSHFKEWEAIFYEVAVAPNECSGMDRTIVRNEYDRKDIHPSHDVDEASTKLKQIRPKLPGDKWWTLTMLVKRDGSVEVNYGYDKNWGDRFYEDYRDHRPF